LTGQALTIRTGADGSFSLWSDAFGEGFHSRRGARREAQETFLIPSELERFPPGRTIRVLEVCVGTGSNLAVLLQACATRGLQLDWIGLELDPEPLRLALGDPAFRASWPPATLTVLQELQQQGSWQAADIRDIGGDQPSGAFAGDQPSRHAPAAGMAAPSSARAGTDGADPGRVSHGRMLWGDARGTLRQLLVEGGGRFDLIWHDAFSPQRCPQLWTVEFLKELCSLLGPEGRWLSYCSAAAVREALRMVPLQLAALPAPAAAAGGAGSATAAARRIWSGGTLASPMPLEPSRLWRPLSPLEREHLASSAGEPYRDPDGRATAAAIHSRRQLAQAAGLARGERQASGAWRRRWGLTAGA